VAKTSKKLLGCFLFKTNSYNKNEYLIYMQDEQRNQPSCIEKIFVAKRGWSLFITERVSSLHVTGMDETGIKKGGC
jgi:hypothetical protein